MPLDEDVTFPGVKVIRETEKAILVEMYGDDEVWVPKSVISDDSEVWSMKNGEGDLIVKRWWANERGLQN